MSGFIFNTIPSIICEPGAIRKLGELVRKQIGQKVMVVTDKGLIAAGILSPVTNALEAEGIEYVVFDSVLADPSAEIVEDAKKQAVDAKIDGVIGLGGGSPMDVAKLVALLVGSQEKLDDIYGIGNSQGNRLPLIQIPTTSGTGSEVTPISIITVGETEKKGVVTPHLLADIVLLDAELTLGLPSHITAATGVDAMVHAIEAYTSTNANNNIISKMLARQALQLLGANIRSAVTNGQDLAARSNMLLGSMLAGQAFANSPVGAVHALAYPIGGIFHVPHGLSNALVLPYVMRFNAPVCSVDYALLAVDVFPELADVAQDERAEAFAHKMAELTLGLGLKTCLSEVGIQQSDLALLASGAMKQTRLLVNNPRPVNETDALAIYQQAL